MDMRTSVTRRFYNENVHVSTQKTQYIDILRYFYLYIAITERFIYEIKMFGGGCKVSEEQEIKQYLKENGISQVWLSKKTKIPPCKLSYSFNGKRKMTLREYAIICWALGVNTDKFLRPREPSKITV